MADASYMPDQDVVPQDVHELARRSGLGDYEAVSVGRDDGGDTRLIFSRPGGYREEDREAFSRVLVESGLPQSDPVGLLRDGSHIHVDIPNQRESTSMRQALIDAGHEGVEMQTGRTITRLMVGTGDRSVPDTLRAVVATLADKGHVITNAVLLDHVVAVDVPTMERLQRLERGRTAMTDALERFGERSARTGGLIGQAASLRPGTEVSAKGSARDVDPSPSEMHRPERPDRGR